MAINKKLIHFGKRTNFDTEVANGNILDTSIVFIKDTHEIYTHGEYYTCKDWADNIDNLLSQINTLVSGNASTAIESFNEIIAFLEGIEDSESLDSIIASIETLIADINTALANKVDKLTAVTSVAGRTGAVTLTKSDVGLSNVDNTADANKSVNYATSAGSATQDASGNVITATYATKTELNTAKTEAQNYTDAAVANLVDSAPDTLNTLNELATAISEHQEVTDALDAAITNKADKTEIPTKVSELENDVPYANSEDIEGLNVIAIDADDIIEEPDQSYVSKDLSMFDIYGGSTSQNTANCYVVKEAGFYKFPCVYGNAIKDGATNAAAYLNNGGTYSHNFVNYVGNLITSPYIETDTGETIASAQLSISDTDGIFDSISIVTGSNCSYVRFKINSVPDTGANGVISIKNAAGTIMWNWHIWVWKDDLTPVTITNSTSITYNILPVNLASKWVTNSSNPTLMTNWYYLWGRSVPILGPTTYNSTTNATPSSDSVLSFTITANSSGTYQQGITNPTTHFTRGNNSNYNWFGTSGSYYNLWDQACTVTGCSDNTVVKTVYDPCPPGFKMPNGNTFTGFTTTGSNTLTSSSFNVVGSFSNGWYFKKNSSDTTGIFFPTSGNRNYSSGSLSNVGSNGYVWSAAAYSQSNAYLLYFDSGRVDPLRNLGHAYGFSVRPVAES